MAYGGAGAFAGGEGDPRLSVDAANPARIAPRHRLLHDPKVSYEEYRYYAARTRAEEEASSRLDQPKTTLKNIIFPPKNGPSVTHVTSNGEGGGAPTVDAEKRHSVSNLAKKEERLHITDEEWTNASRALRTATWAACFYLITTDILGPFGIGFVPMLTPLLLS